MDFPQLGMHSLHNGIKCAQFLGPVTGWEYFLYYFLGDQAGDHLAFFVIALQMAERRGAFYFVFCPMFSPVSYLNIVAMWSIKVFILEILYNLIENTGKIVKILIRLLILINIKQLLIILPRLQQHIVNNKLHEHKINNLRFLQLFIQS